MSHHAAHGLSIDLPPGWNGQIYRRREVDEEAEPQAQAAGRAARRRRPARDAAESGAVMRAATVPIESHDGDFGGGIVQRMRGLDAFVVLFEYTVDEKLTPGEGLFASRRIPWPLDASEFSTQTLHITLPGHAGTQRFFTAGGRPFCLYAVLGSVRRLRPTLAGVNRVLDSVGITPAGR